MGDFRVDRRREILITGPISSSRLYNIKKWFISCKNFGEYFSNPHHKHNDAFQNSCCKKRTKVKKVTHKISRMFEIGTKNIFLFLFFLFDRLTATQRILR